MADEKDPKDTPAGEGPTSVPAQESSSHPISPDPEKPDKGDLAGATPADGAAEAPPLEGASTEGEAAAPKKGKSKLLALIGAGLAGILLIASITAAIVFALAWHKNKDTLADQDSAREAACNYAPTLATYDFNHLDDYFKKVLDGSTGDFKKQFSDSSKELKDVLVQGQVVSKVADSQCAIKSASDNHAEAIVVIGQSITSVGTQGKPQPGQLAMVASMDKVDGKWLVSKMDAPLMKPAG